MDKVLLPINKEEMLSRGWDRPDFVYVIGDAYVDHPSFGPAIISRVLESGGFRVAILSQPSFKNSDAFGEFGCPRLGFLVSAGNIDSMVAHYTVAKRKRTYDYYSPGGKTGLRPDRATIVYCNRIRELFPDSPIVIGGLEASLRRFAHYDYWDNRVRNSILIDSGADILSYGMGEKSVLRIAELLGKGVPIHKIRDVRGTCFICKKNEKVHYDLAGFSEIQRVKNDKKAYAEAFKLQYMNQDAVSGKAVIEYYGDRMLVQNPPMPPLERDELDRVYALEYTRKYHPSYEKLGGIPGFEEVKYSITHNRGCFGGCSFCAITYHQGRAVRSRSIESCVDEAKKITEMPNFKGYIHDVGGPTANFRYPSCKKQLESGVCLSKHCLSPEPCKNLIADHREYTELLESIEKVKGVKKVFVRSGIRYDYVLADKSRDFIKKIVRDNVSGQLRVAPEHVCEGVLALMGKPPFDKYEKFCDLYSKYSAENGLNQYVVPYLMSSHPGSTLDDAVELALYLKKNNIRPEQVQDFYPTPGTVSTVMYYTSINPLNGKAVYCAVNGEEKKLQRALLQCSKPENAPLVRKALKICGHEDLERVLLAPVFMRKVKNSKKRIGLEKARRGADSAKSSPTKIKEQKRKRGKQ